MCSSGAWAFSSGRPKPISTQGTLKVSYICVTNGIEPPSRMNTAFLPKPCSRACCAVLKIGWVKGATQGFPEQGFGKKAVFIREGGSIPFVTQMYDTFK